jgi:hypothetical protein
MLLAALIQARWNRGSAGIGTAAADGDAESPLENSHRRPAIEHFHC